MNDSDTHVPGGGGPEAGEQSAEALARQELWAALNQILDVHTYPNELHMRKLTGGDGSHVEISAPGSETPLEQVWTIHIETPYIAVDSKGEAVETNFYYQATEDEVMRRVDEGWLPVPESEMKVLSYVLGEPRDPHAWAFLGHEHIEQHHSPAA